MTTTTLSDGLLCELSNEVHILCQADQLRRVDHESHAPSILEQHDDAPVALECCICLSPFQIIDGPNGPIERRNTTTLSNCKLVREKPSSTTNKEPNCISIVQTIACGHLFHKHCLGSWIAGQARTLQRTMDSRSEPANPATNHSIGPARSLVQGTTCPLCRTELLPPKAKAS
jgi:hypothetical protein